MITPPLVFVMFGFVIGGEGLSIAEVNPEHSTIHLVAELTLILVLFSDAARPATLLYAVLSLTVIRMLPVAISLVGAGLRPPSYLFLGWFGPRGLASILFVLLILEEAEVVHRDELLAITVVTVALSVLLHGLTAAPFASRYAQRVARIGECEEIQPVPEMPLRKGRPELAPAP